MKKTHRSLIMLLLFLFVGGLFAACGGAQANTNSNPDNADGEQAQEGGRQIQGATSGGMERPEEDE